MKLFNLNHIALKSKIVTAAVALAVFTFPVIKAADSILGIEGESHSSVGIYIKDLKADTIVFEHDAERTLIPASITKALTSATAMFLLGPDYRFETKVYTAGSVVNGVLNGNLIIKASGDPTLDSEQFPENKGFVNEIVRAVKERGISRINGRVILEKVNPDYDYPEGQIDWWGIDDTPWSYGAGIFDFNWADNYYSYYPANGESRPHIPDAEYEIWKNPLPPGFNLYRGINSRKLILTGGDLKKDKKRRVNTSMPYPFDAFRYRLEKDLADCGIEVCGDTVDPENRSKLLTHRSPRLAEIMKSMMLRSDNMFTEGVFRRFNSSPKKFGDRDDAVKVEKNLWKERGLEPQYITIHDGSGLSRADQISPAFMGRMLESMASSKHAVDYVSLFPVAGKSGTMKNFMASTPLSGRLAMKTGSMSAVQCYAGYLLDDNGSPTHVVVVMVNNFFCPRASLKNAISKMLLEKLN